MNRLGGLALFTLAYFVILEVLLVGAVLFWPSFSTNLPAIKMMASSLAVVGDMVQAIDDKGARAYIVGQHFFKGCCTLGTAAAVLFAAPAVAGEAHRGTLELWLARPFSRTRLLFERYAAGALALVLPIFLSTLTIPALCAHVAEPQPQPYGPWLLAATHQSIFLLAIYSTTFLCSSLGSNPTKIALAVLFVTTFEFAVYMIKVLTHWSLFRLCDLQTLLAVVDDEALDARLVGALLAWSVLCAFLARLAFLRRTP